MRRALDLNPATESRTPAEDNDGVCAVDCVGECGKVHLIGISLVINRIHIVTRHGWELFRNRNYRRICSSAHGDDTIMTATT